MKQYIQSQIMNMKAFTKTFKASCHMAAIKNDGHVDDTEAKILKQIDKATDKFIKELESIKY